jgi:hypothetical protein
MRIVLLAVAFGSLLALAGCSMPGAPADATRLESTAGERAAPAPASDAVKPGAQSPEAPAEGELQAPPMSDPLPPEKVSDATPPALDRSCRTASDCAVKNVGNCCGMQPACVNVNSPTDPAAVQAQCAREGRMSVCGFKPVEACECVAGKCEDKLMASE